MSISILAKSAVATASIHIEQYSYAHYRGCLDYYRTISEPSIAAPPEAADAGGAKVRSARIVGNFLRPPRVKFAPADGDKGADTAIRRRSMVSWSIAEAASAMASGLAIKYGRRLAL